MTRRTSLANSDAHSAHVIGNDFCPRNATVFSEVMALRGPADLPAYAAGKDLVPADLGACDAAPPTPWLPAVPRADGERTHGERKPSPAGAGRVGSVRGPADPVGRAGVFVAGLPRRGAPPRPPATVYSVDLKGVARLCTVPNPLSPSDGKPTEAQIVVGNDGGWCGGHGRRTWRPALRGGAAHGRPAHGRVYIHTVGYADAHRLHTGSELRRNGRLRSGTVAGLARLARFRHGANRSPHLPHRPRPRRRPRPPPRPTPPEQAEGVALPARGTARLAQHAIAHPSRTGGAGMAVCRDHVADFHSDPG